MTETYTPPTPSLENLTAQRIFDETAQHLFAQGRRAGYLSEDRQAFMCAYREPEGSGRCAVGYWIPDEVYDADRMEQKNSDYVLSSFESLLPLRRFASLFDELQGVHDGGGAVEEPAQWESTEGMRAKLRGVADGHDLDVSILETLSFSDR